MTSEIKPFDFGLYFTKDRLKGIDTSLPPNSELSVRILMSHFWDLDCLRAFIAHEITNMNGFNDLSLFVRRQRDKFITEKNPLTNWNTHFKTSGRTDEQRSKHHHSLTKEGFKNDVAPYISADNKFLLTVSVIQNLLLKHFDELFEFLKKQDVQFINGDFSLPKSQENRMFMTFWNNMKSLIMGSDFINEFAPPMIQGAPEHLRHGRNIDSQTVARGLAHSFQINVFETDTKCPFRKFIGHIFNTTLIENDDGTLSVSEDTHSGALFAFIAGYFDHETENLENILETA